MCNALIKYLVFGEYQNKSTCPLIIIIIDWSRLKQEEKVADALWFRISKFQSV